MRARRELLEFITIALLLTFALGSLDADLLVVFFESGQILARLRKFAFLHSLADIPMHKSTLGVHEVELVIDTRKYFRDGRRVADHAAGAHHFRKVTAWNDCRWLIVDSALETSGRPIDELDCAL